MSTSIFRCNSKLEVCETTLIGLHCVKFTTFETVCMVIKHMQSQNYTLKSHFLRYYTSVTTMKSTRGNILEQLKHGHGGISQFTYTVPGLCLHVVWRKPCIFKRRPKT